MKSEIVLADGRRINLAGTVDPITYAELEQTPSRLHDPALRCGGCGGGISIHHGRRNKDELFGYHHHNTEECTATFVVRKSRMSDEHKREAEYHVRAAERRGHVGDFEVTTTGNTRVDVVIDGRVGFEIQRSELGQAAAVDRTARSVQGGLSMVAWFTDKTTSPPWTGRVPGYRSLREASAWRVLPTPGTVRAAGLQVVEAVQCGTRAPCPHRRRPCNQYVPWVQPWGNVLIDDVVAGLAEGAIRPVHLGKLVRLMPADDIALYEELAGVRLRYDAGQPKGRALASSESLECSRPAVPEAPWRISPAIAPPVLTRTVAGRCIIPACGNAARLYPGGWFCDDHKPGKARA